MDTSRPSIYFRAKQISPILRRHLHTCISFTELRLFELRAVHSPFPSTIFEKTFRFSFYCSKSSPFLSRSHLSPRNSTCPFAIHVIPIAWNPPGRKTLACKQPQGELLPPSSFAFEIRLPLKISLNFKVLLSKEAIG